MVKITSSSILAKLLSQDSCSLRRGFRLVLAAEAKNTASASPFLSSLRFLSEKLSCHRIGCTDFCQRDWAITASCGAAGATAMS